MPLSNETFRLLRDMIYAHSGIFFNESKKYLLETRLSQRIEERNCQTFEDYYYFLKYDPGREAEFLCLFDVVTTNETSFFRDPSQIKAFENGVLHTLVKEKEAKRDRKLRVWSAGCSTGEEPYTLAMIIKEKQELLKNWTLEIMASDISESVLKSAKKAIYTQNAVRNTPPFILKKYFQNSGSHYSLKDEVKNLVRFQRVNLIDQARLKTIRGMDVVFCRNVLIYFDDKAKKQVVSGFYDSLNPGGYLFLGPVESLYNISRAFKLVNVDGRPLYKKEAV